MQVATQTFRKIISILNFSPSSHRMDPGSGNLITFGQFVFIALEGLIFTSKFGTEPLRIPFLSYMTLVVMFFVSSVANNYAFDFNIPMPLHMIFRAVRCDKNRNYLRKKIKHSFFPISFIEQGSLIANMVMGIIILKRRYDFSKYLSVLMITAGIVICTIVSGSNVVSMKTSTQILGFWLSIHFPNFSLFFPSKMLEKHRQSWSSERRGQRLFGFLLVVVWHCFAHIRTVRFGSHGNLPGSFVQKAWKTSTWSPLYYGM